MTQKISTGLANALLTGSGGLTTIFPGFRLRIYDDVMVHADDAEGGTPICELTVDGDTTTDLTFDATATDGVLMKNPAEVWAGTVTASGECKTWRIVLPADAGTASTTAPRIQGTIGMAGKDILVGDPAFIISETFTLANFYQAFKIA